MIEISPSGPIRATVQIPGSKYVANRVLFIAALARGNSRLFNLPVNEDIETARKGISSLGITMEEAMENGKPVLKVTGCAGVVPGKDAEVYTAGSGTFSRFFLPFAAMSQGKVRVTANEKMSTRPMGEIFQALRSLGVRLEAANGCLPATIYGGLRGGTVEIEGSVSSQYFSAFLLSGIYAKEPIHIKVKGKLISRNYIDMTANLMKDFGAVIQNQNYEAFTIPPNQTYLGRDFQVEVDPVSSSYFMAAAAATGGEVRIPGFNPHSAQGEAGFPEVLRDMGCDVSYDKDTLVVKGPMVGSLRAVTRDMGDMPDVVQTLAVLAAFATGDTKVTNIAHLKFKESDRIGETAEELRKLGVSVESGDDFMVIHGKGGAGIHGADIESRQDHRMAMSFAIAGLAVPGLRIHGEDCVSKSFPDFFERLALAGASVRRA